MTQAFEEKRDQLRKWILTRAPGEILTKQTLIGVLLGFENGGADIGEPLESFLERLVGEGLLAHEEPSYRVVAHP